MISFNGTDSIGGAFANWNGNRTPALQIDTPSNGGAYMGIRFVHVQRQHGSPRYHPRGQRRRHRGRQWQRLHVVGRHVAPDYLSNLSTGKAATRSLYQWASGITEFGSVPTGESGGMAALPAPWGLVGLRNTSIASTCAPWGCATSDIDTMLTHDELIYCIQQQYPEAVHVPPSGSCT